MIYCISLHRHRDKIKDGVDPKDFLDNNEDVKAFNNHKVEIDIVIKKNKRVYLVHEPDFEFSGIFHSADVKRLMRVINKPSKDGLDQNIQICRLMAAGNSEGGTLKLINDISFDNHEVPATFLLSLGNILLTKEGVGIAEAGKN